MAAFPIITQTPAPGTSRVHYCGDVVTLHLHLSFPAEGRAWVRTDLGRVSLARKEVIRRVEKGDIKLGEAWHDIEMVPDGDNSFKISLPLTDPGFFHAKCFFIHQDHTTPLWPEGDNSILNVEPAGTVCGNIIYNAFVRQFAKTRPGAQTPGKQELSESISLLDEKGYTVIPESGKFRDLKEQLDFIFSTLGCRILHLLPIHPVPTTYARMGRFGSPYAALNFTDVDPALAVFDPAATPMEQFLELVDMVHFYDGSLFMDIAINHTGWAAAIHESHPEWLVRDSKGEIQAPGAWGVVWADLTRLDYSNTQLWEYMADIFLLWCHRGVDGFRCDAGYMIPVDAWEYITAKVRQQYPETIFFLEGLGGPLKTTREILSRANFNWAYSELFQNYSRDEILNYLPPVFDSSDTHGHFIHFAETHDNNRLAAVSHCYAKMRTSLCALFSVCGGFGFANGVEWYATQKIDVHESRQLNWGSKENQVAHISRLNTILKSHPCFNRDTALSWIENHTPDILLLLRHNQVIDEQVLVLLNLDCENEREAVWDQKRFYETSARLHDLIMDCNIEFKTVGNTVHVNLSPGQAMVLSPLHEKREGPGSDRNLKPFKQINENEFASTGLAPGQVVLQKLKTKALNIHIWFNGCCHMDKTDVEKQAVSLSKDPVAFIRSFNDVTAESNVICFDVHTDIQRQVMVPPGFFLLLTSKDAFSVRIVEERRSGRQVLGFEKSMRRYDQDNFFAVFNPFETNNGHKTVTLDIRIFTSEGTRVEQASIMYLAPFERLMLKTSFTRTEVVKYKYLKLMAATNRGGMMRAAASWGNIYSKYDAFLGANLDPDRPENRWMVFSRCRIWAIFQGYSRELVPDCLERFTFSYDHGGMWLFDVPTSEGNYYVLELYAHLDPKDNHMCLAVKRRKAGGGKPHLLADDKPVTIIMRPDIEDRSFHEPVKAFTGPEQEWPDAVSPFENGFSFHLSRDKKLMVNVTRGAYIHEPEWHYMVHNPLETQRGLDDHSDHFSPGYFSISCTGGDQAVLSARVLDKDDAWSLKDAEEKVSSLEQKQIFSSASFQKRMPLLDAVVKSLDAFIVDRDGQKSVIAGYPWFLDWGRDSLIFCRSLIELERFSEARAMLRLFGRFEDNGTLPNMICGADAANIETSDAPLWFFACCKDLVRKEASSDFLQEKLTGRTILEILVSIADSLISGTKTGVKADTETLLLFSPSHFTWMDTNFPAGTPRQGYPIEIQALWYNALDFLASVDEKQSKKWREKAKMVQSAILELFYKPEGYFTDCLHSDSHVGAKEANADDAIRPNQLFLFTLDVIQDKKIAAGCLEFCQQLLIPGAIRSLADQKVETGIHIVYSNRLLKDPHTPYSGIYKGDEDTMRKPAYHNGTAWTWPFPAFCEAWVLVFGKPSIPTGLAWLGSVLPLMRKNAAGYIPEILDGDSPHTERGCDAQAWGSSEFARVIHKLTAMLP